MSNVTATQVLAELEHVKSLNLEVANDLFAMGGQLCHVRFVELVPESGPGSAPVSTALLMCYTLRSGALLTKPLEEWLPYNEFQAATSDELRGLCASAASHVDARERPTNYALQLAMSSPPLAGAQEIWKIEPELHRGEAANPFGPIGTHQMLWYQADRFYFLQVHIES
jgi:hypothetical protein